jgi:hypothetical protein
MGIVPLRRRRAFLFLPLSGPTNNKYFASLGLLLRSLFFYTHRFASPHFTLELQ